MPSTNAISDASQKSLLQYKRLLKRVLQQESTAVCLQRAAGVSTEMLHNAEDVPMVFQNAYATSSPIGKLIRASQG